MASESSPLRQRGQRTRNEIVATSRRLFSEHGYHGTALADIQAATGLTKGAFYHHFHSKEEVAMAALEQASREYQQQLIEPARQKKTPADRIRAMLDGIARLHQDPQWCNCQLLATLGAELSAQEQELRSCLQGVLDELTLCWQTLLHEAAEAGQLSNNRDPAATATWILSTVLGASLLNKLDGGDSFSATLGCLKSTLLVARPQSPVQVS